MEVKAVWTRIQDNTPSADGSGSSSDSYDQMDALTRLYMGGQYGSNAVWIQRADETGTAAINGETPKAKWACVRNPYAREGQPKGGWFCFDENGTMKNSWYTKFISKPGTAQI